jgi:ABC-type lipoprotein export system ATPase subunit
MVIVTHINIKQHNRMNNTNIEINPQFARAAELMGTTDKCLFITGKAGTGKSTLLDHFCNNSKKQPVVLAPTGVAALNVGGQTIHSFFNFYVDVTPEKIL